MKLYTNPNQLNQPPGYGRIGAQRVIVSPVERRAAAAKVAGIDMEIALALGDRDAARQHMREMYAQVEARISARDACHMGKGA